MLENSTLRSKLKEFSKWHQVSFIYTFTEQSGVKFGPDFQELSLPEEIDE